MSEVQAEHAGHRQHAEAASRTGARTRSRGRAAAARRHGRASAARRARAPPSRPTAADASQTRGRATGASGAGPHQRCEVAPSAATPNSTLLRIGEPGDAEKIAHGRPCRCRGRAGARSARRAGRARRSAAGRCRSSPELSRRPSLPSEMKRLVARNGRYSSQARRRRCASRAAAPRRSPAAPRVVSADIASVNASSVLPKTTHQRAPAGTATASRTGR